MTKTKERGLKLETEKWRVLFEKITGTKFEKLDKMKEMYLQPVRKERALTISSPLIIVLIGLIDSNLKWNFEKYKKTQKKDVSSYRLWEMKIDDYIDFSE